LLEFKKFKNMRLKKLFSIKWRIFSMKKLIFSISKGTKKNLQELKAPGG